jgi:hypothetical protein
MPAATTPTPRQLALIAALQRNRGELTPVVIERILGRLQARETLALRAKGLR